MVVVLVRTRTPQQPQAARGARKWQSVLKGHLPQSSMDEPLARRSANPPGVGGGAGELRAGRGGTPDVLECGGLLFEARSTITFSAHLQQNIRNLRLRLLTRD